MSFRTRLSLQTNPRRHAALALTLALASACTPSGGPAGRADEKTPSDGGADDPVPVEVVTLESGEIEEVLRFSANLEAERQVEVLARTPGLVRQVLVEEGDNVAQGAVLLRLEQEEQQSQLARAANDLARAERELALQKQLRERGVTSEQMLETAEYERKRIALLRDDAARALRYTVVTAPIAGTITQRMVERGDNVTIQQPLFQVTDFDSLVARVYVPEKELVALRPGLEARITATATGDAQHRGVVDRIAPHVDARSGTVKVTIAVPRPKEGAVRLFPGMFVDVALVTEKHAQAVLLPKRAIVYDNDIAYAFKLVGENRVERVRVEPVLESRFHIEPASGFAAGDRVVIAGQVGLKESALVAPQAAPAAAGATAATPPDAPAKPADAPAEKPAEKAADAPAAPGDTPQPAEPRAP
jgi:membrane fusion protein (multidrug efflux system)